MTTFDERFAARGAPRLLEEFGESVVYKPHGGAPRTITAMVTRNPPELLTEGIRSGDLIVKALNSATTGIASHLIQPGEDKITCAKIKGGPVEVMSVLLLLDGEGGMTEIQVR